MPHRRTVKKGSFGAHFDELVKHFPHDYSPGRGRLSEDEACDLKEKRDIHALLFERAWRDPPLPSRERAPSEARRVRGKGPLSKLR